MSTLQRLAIAGSLPPRPGSQLEYLYDVAEGRSTRGNRSQSDEYTSESDWKYHHPERRQYYQSYNDAYKEMENGDDGVALREWENTKCGKDWKDTENPYEGNALKPGFRVVDYVRFRNGTYVEIFKKEWGCRT